MQQLQIKGSTPFSLSGILTDLWDRVRPLAIYAGCTVVIWALANITHLQATFGWPDYVVNALALVTGAVVDFLNGVRKDTRVIVVPPEMPKDVKAVTMQGTRDVPLPMTVPKESDSKIILRPVAPEPKP